MEKRRKLLKKYEYYREELERRHREEKLRYYKPHEKQLLFHKCMKRNRWLLGGNRTGKTEVGAVEVVYLARGIHPYRQTDRPTEGWVVSLTNEVQRDVAQKKVLSYLNPAWIKNVQMREGRKDDINGGIIDFIEVECVYGGVSVIGFKTCAQGRERFQGTSLDYVWFDEEPPYEIYAECAMRVIDRKGLLFGTMTPLKGMTWVYDTIYRNESGDPEVWCMSVSWKDNPYLPKEEIERLTASMSKEELAARRDGKFVERNALVYGEFDPEVHVIEPFDVPCEWQECLSIDTGLTNPTSVHWYAVDNDGNVYVVAEYYMAGVGIDEHMAHINEISDVLGWKRDRSGRLFALMDAAAEQHTLNSERSVKELFNEKGLSVCTRVNKSKMAGILRVKEYLRGEPRLYIFNTCPMLIREMKNYRYREDGSDEPIKKDDHALDELRYFIMSLPERHRKEVRKKESVVVRHKKELMKKVRNVE